MTESIIQLTANDYEEAIHFLNTVFAVHGQIDFPVLLPGLYQATEEHMRCNYAVKRGGQIRAIVGLFPMTLCLGDVKLKLGSIGGVSVHPDNRGMGLMNKLMSAVIDVMKQENYHLSWLSGLRQRYNHFGFELCGQKYRFTVDADNIRHHFGTAPEIHFESAPEVQAAPMHLLHQWHDRQFLHVQRSANDFYKILCSWKNKPFIAVDASRRPIGCLVTNSNGDAIYELAGENEEAMEGIVAAWTEQHKTAIHIVTPPLAFPFVKTLSGICDAFSIEPCGNWRVFDWPLVVSAAMKAKSRFAPVPDGAVRLAIGDHPAFEISVEGGRVDVQHTRAVPNIRCDELTALSMLFGALPSELVRGASPSQEALPDWLPLPLYLPRQDEV